MNGMCKTMLATSLLPFKFLWWWILDLFKKKPKKTIPLGLFPSREYFIRDFMFQVMCKLNIGCLDRRGYTKLDQRRDISPREKNSRKQGASVFVLGKKQLFPGQVEGGEEGSWPKW